MVEIFALAMIYLNLGGCLYVAVVYKCLAAGSLLWLCHSFMMALLEGTMVGWYVCTRGRQSHDAYILALMERFAA